MADMGRAGVKITLAVYAGDGASIVIAGASAVNRFYREGEYCPP